MYYKWTIVNGWREEKLKRNQKWFHAFALGFGVSSAAIGIPFYDITPFGCHLYPIPVSETYPWMIPLAYLPVLFTISWLTGVMIYIVSRKCPKHSLIVTPALTAPFRHLLSVLQSSCPRQKGEKVAHIRQAKPTIFE